MADLEFNRAEKQRRARLTRGALLYGGLAIAALIICALNVLAIVGIFWRPFHLLVLPLYMMFAAVSLWAGVNFLQTRSKMLLRRDHPDEMENE